MSYKKKGRLERGLESMDEVATYPILAIKDRGILKEVAQELGIRTKLSTKDGTTPIAHYFPVTKKGVLSGYIKRDLKTRKVDAFSAIGDVDISCDMLGQTNCSASGGNKLFIVEGVYDWASAFQVLWFNQKIPKKYHPNVVSVLLGASNALDNMSHNQDFIGKFKETVLVMDSDKATDKEKKQGNLKGQDAVEEIIRVFPDALNVVLSRKDPNEFIKLSPENNLPQDPDALYREMLFQAKAYEPDDFVEGSVDAEELWKPLQEGVHVSTMPKTSNILHGFRKGEMTVILAPAGVGKAQPLFAEIQTPKGTTTIGQLKIGDDIFGADGKIHQVIGVFPQGEREVFKITLSDETEILCDAEHLWKWQSKYQRDDSFRDGFVYPEDSRRWNVTTTIDLQEYLDKSGNKVYLPMTRAVEYPERKMSIHPYVMGVLLGDGSLSNTSISNPEKDIQDRVIELMKGAANIGSEPDIIRVRGIREILRSFSLLDKNSEGKFIPKAYMENSVENRMELLRGLMDTDGWVKDSNVVYYTTSQRMKNDVVTLIQSLGGTAIVRLKANPSYVHNGEQRIGQDCYVVYIKMPRDVIPVSSEKHLAKYKQGQTQARRSVEKIEHVGKMECQCIKTSAEDSLYLTNGYVVTHNTTLITEVAYPLLAETKYKVDMIYAEEDLRKAQQRFIALGCNVPLNKFRQDPTIVPLEQREKVRKQLIDNGRTAWLDTKAAFGKIDPERLLKRLAWSAAKGYDFAFIDHLTMMVYSNSEVSKIDEFLMGLAQHVTSTGQGVIAVSHITRRNAPAPRDKEGNVNYPYWINVRKEDARGAGSYEQLAWNIICIEPEVLENGERGRIRVRVDKNREWGYLGISDVVRMNELTGRLEQAEDEHGY